MAEEEGSRTEAVRSALALDAMPAGTRHLFLIIGKLSSPINVIWLFLTSGAGPSDTRPYRLGSGTAVATRPLEGTRVRASPKNVGWIGRCHHDEVPRVGHARGCASEFKLKLFPPKAPALGL